MVFVFVKLFPERLYTSSPFEVAQHISVLPSLSMSSDRRYCSFVSLTRSIMCVSLSFCLE